MGHQKNADLKRGLRKPADGMRGHVSPSEVKLTIDYCYRISTRCHLCTSNSTFRRLQCNLDAAVGALHAITVQKVGHELRLLQSESALIWGEERIVRARIRERTAN